MATLSVTAASLGPSRAAALAADPLMAPFITPAAKAALLLQNEPVKLDGYSLGNAERAVALLAAHGVPILAGTDAGNPGTTHGASMHGELQLLVEAGLTSQQALAAATSLPAAYFHLADRGRIAPGMRADLLLVRGDPTKDIRVTRDIDGVWRGGVRFDREAYRRAITLSPPDPVRLSPFSPSHAEQPDQADGDLLAVPDQGRHSTSIVL